MSDQSSGPPAEGPPSYPVNAPPMPPPAPPPPTGPPAYPSYPSAPGAPGQAGAGYPPPPGQYPPPAQYGQYPPPSPYGGSASQGVPYAGWGSRLGGWLIDAVIFVVVNGIVGAAFRHSNAGAIRFTMTTNNGTVVHHDRFSFLSLIVVAILGIAYATILSGNARGQTVGMMAVGVRVVRTDTFGPLGYGPAFGRSLLEWVLRFTVVIWILDMLFPLWDRQKQTLHDKAVSTVVIRIRNAG
jgi:uncharacterized RDD family membrane protein YckC